MTNKLTIIGIIVLVIGIVFSIPIIVGFDLYGDNSYQFSVLCFPFIIIGFILYSLGQQGWKSKTFTNPPYSNDK